jgi:DNA-binding MarR family transcriptional regulator
MPKQTPQLRVPLRGELLAKLTQRFPGIDSQVLDLLNSVKRVSQIVSDDFSAALANHGLTEGKFFVIAYLFTEDLLGHPEPSPSDIAENLGVSRATVTGLLDGLERSGLVTRHSFAVDRRMLLVTITQAAKALVDELLPTILATIQPMVSNVLNASEQAALLKLLTKLESSLQPGEGS